MVDFCFVICELVGTESPKPLEAFLKMEGGLAAEEGAYHCPAPVPQLPVGSICHVINTAPCDSGVPEVRRGGCMRMGGSQA